MQPSHVTLSITAHIEAAPEILALATAIIAASEEDADIDYELPAVYDALINLILILNEDFNIRTGKADDLERILIPSQAKVLRGIVSAVLDP